MKKYLKLIAIAVLTAFTTVKLFAAPINIETAKKVGKNFLEKQELKVVTYENTKMAEQLASYENPPFYIFNAENDGWVIVAGDDAITPILAYSKTGHWDANNVAPAAAYMLDVYAASVDAVTVTQEVQHEQWNDLLNPTVRKESDKLQAGVTPLLSTKWDQGHPYNYFCPQTANAMSGYNGRVPVGCGAVAMAQIMYYHKHPTTGQGKYSYNHPTYGTLSANFGNTIYDYDNMLNVYYYNYTEAARNAVATLMFHCGVAVNMDYGPTESGAHITTISNSLQQYFRYNGHIASYKSDYSNFVWETMLKNDLNNASPIFYAGFIGTGGGHGWVIDGYDAQNRFHMNYGWGGWSDGYYTLTSITPTGWNFTANQWAIIGLRPSTVGMSSGTITVEAGTGGTVATNPTNLVNLAPRTRVTLTATVNNPVYSFVNWTRKGTNTVVSSANPYTFYVNGNDALVANFKAPTYTITATAGTNGTVTTSPTNLTNLVSGTNVRLTAKANADYQFVNWTRKSTRTVISSDNPYNFNVSRNDSLVANFEVIPPPTYNLAVETTTGGTIATNPANTTKLDSGVAVRLTANANANYKFVNWTRKSTGSVVSSSNPYNFAIIRNDALVANFIVREFAVELGGVNPVGAGTVTGGTGSYQLNETTTLTATANDGYIFLNWTSNGIVISEANPFTVVVVRDTVLTANFEIDTVSISERINLSTVSISPNPTVSDFTVSFEVLKSGDMRMTLTDLSGREVLGIFDGFVPDGVFTHTVTTNNLAKGVYFLNISIDGNSTVEKLIVID